MIPAGKSPWFSAWFGRHCAARLQRGFSEVRVQGLSQLRDAAAGAPLLLVSNHTAWWDPVLAIWLTQRHCRLDSFAMMDAANLRRLPFFAKLGAFGVDRTDPRDGARAIQYAARLLTAPGRAVWLFAQGDERPITEPLAFKPGAARIAQMEPRARVVPLAIRYEMGNLEHPRLLVSIGAALTTVTTSSLQDAVAVELQRLEAAVRSKDYEPMACLLRRRPSIGGALAERMLAWLTRGAAAPRGTRSV